METYPTKVEFDTRISELKAKWYTTSKPETFGEKCLNFIRVNDFTKEYEAQYSGEHTSVELSRVISKEVIRIEKNKESHDKKYYI